MLHVASYTNLADNVAPCADLNYPIAKEVCGVGMGKRGIQCCKLAHVPCPCIL